MAKDQNPSGLLVKQLAELIDGQLVGDGTKRVQGICSLDEPDIDSLCFVQTNNQKEVLRVIEEVDCAALLLQAGIKLPANLPVPIILVPDPMAAIIQLIPHLFTPPPKHEGISKLAEVDPSANIADSASIGPFSWVGPGAQIKPGAQIYSHVAIYPGATVGENVIVHSHAVIRENCEVGTSCVIQNGTVVGADGFGYIPDKELGLRAVPQIGRVILQDRVDIGANSCIDRATLGSTVIGRSSKLDNLVQVGHNTKIGQASIVCGHSAIAGSCKIGNQVTIGGQVGMADHLQIVDGCRVAGGSGVVKSLNEKADYGGYPAIELNKWRRLHVVLKDLPETVKKMKQFMKEKS